MSGPSERPGPRHRSWLREILVGVVVVVAVVGAFLVSRLGLDRPGRSTPPQTGTTAGGKGTTVTWENYAKIKPDMTSWEVGDLLGTGEVVAEETFEVDLRR